VLSKPVRRVNMRAMKTWSAAIVVLGWAAAATAEPAIGPCPQEWVATVEPSAATAGTAS
jgi:hypothetical protein